MGVSAEAGVGPGTEAVDLRLGAGVLSEGGSFFQPKLRNRYRT